MEEEEASRPAAASLQLLASTARAKQEAAAFRAILAHKGHLPLPGSGAGHPCGARDAIGIVLFLIMYTRAWLVNLNAAQEKCASGRCRAKDVALGAVTGLAQAWLTVFIVFLALAIYDLIIVPALIPPPGSNPAAMALKMLSMKKHAIATAFAWATNSRLVIALITAVLVASGYAYGRILWAQALATRASDSQKPAIMKAAALDTSLFSLVAVPAAFLLQAYLERWWIRH